MLEIPVYATRADTLAGILPKSAIVGRPYAGGAVPTVQVYYEGNRYGAANMVTFADRAMFAYWRMRDNYPTVAQAVVPLHGLQRVGTLYPDHGRVEPGDGRQLYELAQWLEIPLEDSDRLASELTCSGVRV